MSATWMRLKIRPGLMMRLARPSRTLSSAPAPALTGRLELAHLVDPAAVAIAIDTGGGKIPDPGETRAYGIDLRAVEVQHGVAYLVRRHGAQQVRHRRQQLRQIAQRPIAIE